MVRKCKLCEFWETEGSGEGNGQCRHSAPAGGEGPVSWPSTQEDEWCGEFRYHHGEEREVTLKCKFCEFWKTEGSNQESGECHHSAPIESPGLSHSPWPVTRDVQWCGQYLLRHGKLAVGRDKCPV